MSNETTITIAGNLIDDPDLRFTPAGQPFARFRIASTPRYRDGATGEWKDGDTVFLTYVAWRLLAENIAESLEKGMRVIRHRSPPAALIRGPGRRQAHRVRAPCRRGGPGAEQGHGQGRQVQPLRQRPARGRRVRSPATRVSVACRQPRHPTTQEGTMGTTAHSPQDDADTARWVACEQCGQLDHPELTCDQAIEIAQARELRHFLSRIGPILLAALDEAADDRVERVCRLRTVR